MKALITTFIAYIDSVQTKLDLNNLFRVEMMNNVKSLFKTMIEFDMIDDVLTVFKCMNDVYKKVPMIDGPQPIFLAGNFITKTDLIMAVKKALDQKDYVLAKESLFSIWAVSIQAKPFQGMIYQLLSVL